MQLVEHASIAVETPRAADSLEERVLILSTSECDGDRIRETLERSNIDGYVCPTFDVVCPEIDRGAAAVIVTVDALDHERAASLARQLRLQPAWSDIQVILLRGSEESPPFEPLLAPGSNVTALEGPLSPANLISAVRSASRARRKQYEVRDLLDGAERARIDAEYQQLHIEALNEHLKRAMTETHHRVKNNLQIISAMIDLQVMADRDSVPSTEVKRLGMHVRMLAAVHDILTRQAKEDGQATHVSSSEVLNELLPMVRQVAGDRRIQFDVEDVKLSARQSASLAIVVNELISNALKFGKGEVGVRFFTRDGCVILEVTDDGPGFARGFNPDKAESTGLELIENLSRWDLGGTPSYENRPGGGARVTIAFAQQGRRLAA